MKRIIPLSFIVGLVSAVTSVAAVPSLINYQGRLTDSNGDPVVGSKTFAVSIYDASSAGNLLYSESVGSVTLDNKGIYSFQFGGTGTSNTQASETVATTDGTAASFQKVLGNLPVVAGSVSVTDGTYTWDQTAGSSNGAEFDVVYSEALSRVTVLYYNGAPAAGTDITVSYRYGSNGITGALSSGGEHWLELSVDGTPQATRDRVLTVPFAVNAAKAEVADSLSSIDVDLTIRTLQVQHHSYYAYAAGIDKSIETLPVVVGGKKAMLKKMWYIFGKEWRVVTSAEAEVACNKVDEDCWGRIKLFSVKSDGTMTVMGEDYVENTTKLLKVAGIFPLDHENYTYILELSAGTSGAGTGNISTNSTISNCKVSGASSK